MDLKLSFTFLCVKTTAELAKMFKQLLKDKGHKGHAHTRIYARKREQTVGNTKSDA